MDKINLESRIPGCLLGAAVGDALGAPVEFLAWEEIEEKFGEKGVSGFEEAYGRRGAITDDTQMTLFTAEALIRADNRWEAKGVCGLVDVIRHAYYRWLLTQDEQLGLASEAAHITHGHPSGYLSAGAFSLIIDSIMKEKTLLEAIHLSMDYLKWLPSHEETLMAMEQAVALVETTSVTVGNIESLGGGWVAEEALAIALYCALLADDFSTGVLAAVNHSGDSDSTGAICGNILGTLLGVEAVPEKFLDELEARDVIEQLGFDFIDKFIRDSEQGSSNNECYPPN